MPVDLAVCDPEAARHLLLTYELKACLHDSEGETPGEPEYVDRSHSWIILGGNRRDAQESAAA